MTKTEQLQLAKHVTEYIEYKTKNNQPIELCDIVIEAVTLYFDQLTFIKEQL